MHPNHDELYPAAVVLNAGQAGRRRIKSNSGQLFYCFVTRDLIDGSRSPS